jgi:hypothetical protein
MMLWIFLTAHLLVRVVEASQDWIQFHGEAIEKEQTYLLKTTNGTGAFETAKDNVRLQYGRVEVRVGVDATIVPIRRTVSQESEKSAIVISRKTVLQNVLPVSVLCGYVVAAAELVEFVLVSTVVPNLILRRNL